MEHVWSHVLGYLYGAYISTAIIAPVPALLRLAADDRLLWGCARWPLGCCSAAGKIAAQNSEVTKKAALRVSGRHPGALENVREIRAANQEERYLAGLYEKIDQHEKVTIRGELTTDCLSMPASVIMRLGVATTILTGASLILSGQIDFMVLSCSCWSSPGCTPPSTRAWLLSRKCSSPKYLPTASTRSTKPLSPKGRRPSASGPRHYL